MPACLLPLLAMSAQLFAFPPSSDAGTIDFAAPRLFQLGSSDASGVAVADFNRDGRPDVAVTMRSDNAVAVFLNDGRGRLHGPRFFAAGIGPSDVAAGDFNADGNPDLAITNDDAGSLSILLGDGTGGFSEAPASPITLGVGRRPFALAVGRFNADGRQDLAVVEVFGGTIVILLGNGDGTFGEPARFSSGGDRPVHAVTGDFDNDGRLDLAVALCGGSCDAFPQAVALLRGNGDGTFGAPTLLASTAGATRLGAGDFDRDGNLDLAFLGRESRRVVILHGQGDGTFTPGASLVSGLNPADLVVRDLDRDHRLDLMVVNAGDLATRTLGTLQVFRGDGRGGFTELQDDLLVGNGPVRAGAGDFDADGHADVVAINRGSLSQNVVLLLGRGDGHFRVPPRFSVGTQPVFVASADFDRDGNLDLAVANFGSNDVTVLRGDGSGGFVPFPLSPVPAGPTGSAPLSLAVGDFSRDGRPDLAVVNFVGDGEGYVTILLGHGDGGFSHGSTIRVGWEPRAIAVGDFDRDGKLDLAVTLSVNPEDALAFPGFVAILLGKGDGHFRRPVRLGVGTKLTPETAQGFNPVAIVAKDFDRDGNLDVGVANNWTDDVAILFGNGRGGFPRVLNVFVGDFEEEPGGFNPVGITGADFNDDGFPDLATINVRTFDASVLLNTRSGCHGKGKRRGHPCVGFGPPERFPVGDLGAVGVGGIVARDFDGDGSLDLAVVTKNFTDVAVLQGDGGGGFALPQYFGAGNGPSGVAWGDFDRDGKPDLAVVNQLSGDVSVLLNIAPRIP